MKFEILALLLGASLGFTDGYSTGSPSSLCFDPYPHHPGVYASTEPSPYTISVSPNTYSPGDNITVTVEGQINIRGITLAARSAVGDWRYAYGEFTGLAQGIKGYKYYSDKPNCVTHSAAYESLQKQKLEFTWQAPDQNIGDLIFSATVMKDFKHFWVNITANLNAASNSNLNTSLPQKLKATGEHDSALDLSNCGKESGCVTYPAGCKSSSCRYAISYKVTGTDVRFRILSKRASSNYFLALGISTDVFMDKDEVITCIMDGDRQIFQHGYNPAYYFATALGSSDVKELAITSGDEYFMCEFTRPLDYTIKIPGRAGIVPVKRNYSASVDSPDYHLYLGWGQIYKGSYSNMEKHVAIPLVSKHKIAFGEKKANDFYFLHDTVKVHAMFMVVAWFGLASIAMILARYFRQGIASENQKLCGMAAWFQVHRGLLFSVTILTCIGFIIIFTHFMKWTEEQSLHAGFGIAVTAMMLIQILLSFARPAPDSKKRPVFNWLHRLFGMLTYIFSAVTMFLGSRMEYMPEEMRVTGTGLLAGLVATHVFFFILLQIMDCCGPSKPYEVSVDNGKISESNNSMEMLDKDDKSGNKGANSKSTYFSGFSTVKCGFLAAYCLVIMALAVCFSAVLWLYL